MEPLPERVPGRRRWDDLAHANDPLSRRADARRRGLGHARLLLPRCHQRLPRRRRSSCSSTATRSSTGEVEDFDGGKYVVYQLSGLTGTTTVRLDGSDAPGDPTCSDPGDADWREHAICRACSSAATACRRSAPSAATAARAGRGVRRRQQHERRRLQRRLRRRRSAATASSSAARSATTATPTTATAATRLPVSALRRRRRRSAARSATTATPTTATAATQLPPRGRCGDGVTRVRRGLRRRQHRRAATAATPTARDDRCGDGVTERGEECDDGNTDDGDGCDAQLLATRCGDGVARPRRAVRRRQHRRRRRLRR